MTKKEALLEFWNLHSKEDFEINMPERELFGVRLKYKKYMDGPAMSQAWNNFTDALAREGKITRKQYSSWVNPF